MGIYSDRRSLKIPAKVCNNCLRIVSIRPQEDVLSHNVTHKNKMDCSTKHSRPVQYFSQTVPSKANTPTFTFLERSEKAWLYPKKLDWSKHPMDRSINMQRAHLFQQNSLDLSKERPVSVQHPLLKIRQMCGLCQALACPF